MNGTEYVFNYESNNETSSYPECDFYDEEETERNVTNIFGYSEFVGFVSCFLIFI